MIRFITTKRLFSTIKPPTFPTISPISSKNHYILEFDKERFLHELDNNPSLIASYFFYSSENKSNILTDKINFGANILKEYPSKIENLASHSHSILYSLTKGKITMRTNPEVIIPLFGHFINNSHNLHYEALCCGLASVSIGDIRKEMLPPVAIEKIFEQCSRIVGDSKPLLLCHLTQSLIDLGYTFWELPNDLHEKILKDFMSNYSGYVDKQGKFILKILAGKNFSELPVELKKIMKEILIEKIKPDENFNVSLSLISLLKSNEFSLANDLTFEERNELFKKLLIEVKISPFKHLTLLLNILKQYYFEWDLIDKELKKEFEEVFFKSFVESKRIDFNLFTTYIKYSLMNLLEEKRTFSIEDTKFFSENEEKNCLRFRTEEEYQNMLNQFNAKYDDRLLINFNKNMKFREIFLKKFHEFLPVIGPTDISSVLNYLTRNNFKFNRFSIELQELLLSRLKDLEYKFSFAEFNAYNFYYSVHLEIPFKLPYSKGSEEYRNKINSYKKGYQTFNNFNDSYEFQPSKSNKEERNTKTQNYYKFRDEFRKLTGTYGSTSTSATDKKNIDNEISIENYNLNIMKNKPRESKKSSKVKNPTYSSSSSSSTIDYSDL